MATLAQKIRRGLQDSGLLEPKTRGKKMRAILPELDLIREGGPVFMTAWLTSKPKA